MILRADKPIPDEIPEGYNYYLFMVEDENGIGCGCFIGESPEDIYEMRDIVKRFAGCEVTVAKVGREKFIEGFILSKKEKMAQDIKSVKKDSPAA